MKAPNAVQTCAADFCSQRGTEHLLARHDLCGPCAAMAAMNKELDQEMTDEERARKEKSGMGIFGGVNKGEEQLFEKKLSKEEKKAAADAKRAELAAKKVRSLGFEPATFASQICARRGTHAEC